MRILPISRSIFAIIALSLFSVSTLFAKSITEDPNYSYEALFTNPICNEYAYPEEVLANNGDVLKSKPKDAFCTSKDREKSANRENSPHKRLVEWIQNPNVSSISLAYFSFSDAKVLEELCLAISRGVKVRLVLDAENETGSAPQALKKCGGELLPRGHTSGLDLAHIKLVLFEVKDQSTLKVVFSSGNLTAGTVLHHENWSFIKVSRSAYFAQEHLCAYDGMVTALTGDDFRASLKNCRSLITATPESDIKSFFIPADNKAAINLFLDSINSASDIKIAIHRFSNKKIIKALNDRLVAGSTVQLLSDDDLYWAQQGLPIGPNTKLEAEIIDSLIAAGMQTQYIETNHYEKLLHHNKFAIFGNQSVWTGAGNLTNAGFSGNYENFYFISIPEVVQKFNEQYAHMWNTLSTKKERMPQRIIKPLTQIEN